MKEKNIKDTSGAENTDFTIEQLLVESEPAFRKYDPVTIKKATTNADTAQTTRSSTSAESVLRTIASIELWVGLIVALILLVYSIDSDGWEGTGIAIGVGVWSVTSWAILRVISNISTNLFAIKDALSARKDAK